MNETPEQYAALLALIAPIETMDEARQVLAQSGLDLETTGRWAEGKAPQPYASPSALGSRAHPRATLAWNYLTTHAKPHHPVVVAPTPLPAPDPLEPGLTFPVLVHRGPAAVKAFQQAHPGHFERLRGEHLARYSGRR